MSQIHDNILAVFKSLCPYEPVKMWWKKGKNCIRIRRGEGSGSDIFFTYIDPIHWKIETKTMFEAATDGI